MKILTEFWRYSKYKMQRPFFSRFFKVGLLLFALVVIQSQQACAQDSLTLTTNGLDPDTILVVTPDEHSPGLASLYSAVLPGLGQAYNGKHWKIPVIYGGFFTFGFLVYDNNVKYQVFRKNLIAELDNDPETINNTGRDANNLRANRDNFRRLRDLNIILIGVTYLLQIADAHIDAHLLGFKISQDISVSVDPEVFPQNNRLHAGVSLKFNLK